jgi:quercetin dioxygenase-like cupin family protein
VRSVKDDPIDVKGTDAVPNCQEIAMAINEHIRRDILQALAILPLIGLAAHAGEAAAQTAGSPVKVDTNGLVAKIKFEAPLSGFLSEINGKYKLRVTELTLAPGGHVGEHNHVGPGIRQVTSGYMTYVLPDKTVVYGPGDFFFESGDINHTVFNKTNDPMVHVLFEILPLDLDGPSLIPVKHH